MKVIAGEVVILLPSAWPVAAATIDPTRKVIRLTVRRGVWRMKSKKKKTHSINPR